MSMRIIPAGRSEWLRPASDSDRVAPDALISERLLESIGEPRSVRETPAVIVGGGSGEQRLVPLPLEPLPGTRGSYDASSSRPGVPVRRCRDASRRRGTSRVAGDVRSVDDLALADVTPKTSA
jgi:hypothetical protein